MKEDQGRYFFLYFRGFGELHYCRLYPLFDLCKKHMTAFQYTFVLTLLSPLEHGKNAGNSNCCKHFRYQVVLGLGRA